MNYDLIPEHCRGAVQRYIEQGIEPGGFLCAVFSNDLTLSMGKADYVNRGRIFDYCLFLCNEAPRDCWGSRKAVHEWARHGGLNGLNAQRHEASVAPLA